MKAMRRLVPSLTLLLLVGGCGQPSTTEEAAAEAAESAPPAETAAPTPPPVAEPVQEAREPGWKQKLEKPAMMTFDPAVDIFWVIKTNVGDMRFKLFADTAPMHVTSTIFLTEQGFYDDIIFHRVIDGFMAQGGDPTGTGSGGPGYSYAGEFDGDRKHDRPGLLSMANAGPNTDGSQFFITFVPTPWLDGKHTLFGELVEGMETVKALEARGSRGGRTTERLVIEQATIERQPRG